MKALNSVLGCAALALALGCEIHVGDGDFDSDFFDDLDAGSAPHPGRTSTPTSTEPSEQDAGVTTPAPTTSATPATAATSAASVGSAAASASSSSAPSSTSVTSATPSATMGMVTPTPSYLCQPPASATTAMTTAAICDRCLDEHCKPERTACCGAACETQWPSVRECMENGNMFNVEGNLELLDECIKKAAPADDPMLTGAGTEAFNDVLVCVNMTGSDGTTGTCTSECYGIDTLMP